MLVVELELLHWEFAEQMNWDCNNTILRSRQKEGDPMGRSPLYGSVVTGGGDFLALRTRCWSWRWS